MRTCVEEVGRKWGASLAAVLVAWGGAVSLADVPEWIDAIQRVEPRGAGHVEAVAAVRNLQEADARALSLILEAMNTANPLAINWLRNAFETIADRTLRDDEEFPLSDLLEFFGNHANKAEARRLAYEWALKVNPALAEQIIPEALHDPSSEMRRDAVARLIRSADAFRREGMTQQALTTYRHALTGAVDDDQVKAIVGPLRELGEEVDLQRHFGFVTRWSLIGPFDNRDMAGFDVVYPPEEEVDLTATYSGQLGPVTWETYSTDDEYGLFDIAKSTAPHKGAITYAYTEFHAGEEQQVQFRLGTSNAWKLWLNGELLFAREEYHRGMFLDQYIVEGTLRPGANQLLLKVCQNEQEEEWAQDWSFQFRVSDHSGRAVHPVGAAVSAN